MQRYGLWRSIGKSSVLHTQALHIMSRHSVEQCQAPTSNAASNSPLFHKEMFLSLNIPRIKMQRCSHCALASVQTSSCSLFSRSFTHCFIRNKRHARLTYCMIDVLCAHNCVWRLLLMSGKDRAVVSATHVARYATCHAAIRKRMQFKYTHCALFHTSRAALVT